jgi:hypothetical protein
MSEMEGPPPGRGVCPECGEPNACALTGTPATGGASCWCFELPPVMPMPPSGSDAHCYCRQCLEALIAAPGGAPRRAASAKRAGGNPPAGAR